MNNSVTIAMIEDDEGHARLIEKNIIRAGVTNPILKFTTGQAAWEYLDSPERAHSLLILLDLNLPDMTGIDILQRLKQDDVAQKRTGDHTDDNGRQARNRALLRVGLQRLYHQAGGVRAFRSRHPAARAILFGHSDAGGRMNGADAASVSCSSMTMKASAVSSSKDLERHGYDAEIAFDGASGLKRIAAGGIDAVVLDHHLPDSDGLSILQEIQKLDRPAAGHLPHRRRGQPNRDRRPESRRRRTM